MIKVIHRVNEIEKLKSLAKNNGVEIDIRSYNSKIILNHEPLINGIEFEEYVKNFDHALLICNVKESGLDGYIIDILDKYDITNYFLLDIDMPTVYKFINNKFSKFALRVSRLEPIESINYFENFADWIWFDTISDFDISNHEIGFLKQTKLKICLTDRSIISTSFQIKKNWLNFFEDNNIPIEAICTK